MSGSFTPSRRAFAGGLLAIASGGALPLAAAPAAQALPVRRHGPPVVTFHRDELYVDWTGQAEAYRPPAGLRSAAPVEHLSESEFRWLHGWA